MSQQVGAPGGHVVTSLPMVTQPALITSQMLPHGFPVGSGAGGTFNIFLVMSTYLTFIHRS